MRPAYLSLIALLLLSACGGPSEEDVLTPERIRESESATQLPDIQLSEDPEPEPAPPPEPEVKEAEPPPEDGPLAEGVPGTIPPSFQGSWGRVQADCRLGAVSGTGMLIGPDSLVFADSDLSLQGVLDESPSRFSGRFSDRDGYERREDLELGGGGNLLSRSSGGQRSVYRRCA